ncbi:MAG: gamma-glutamyl-phosphate reductase, partial [Methylococcales bacterium]
MDELELNEYINQLGKQARKASRILAAAPSGTKNLALVKIADALDRSRSTLLHENARDLEAAHHNHLDLALMDRLELTEKRIQGM